MKFVLGMVVGMAMSIAGGYFGVKKLFESEEVNRATRRAVAELILGRKINWDAESVSHHYDWTDYSKYVSEGVQEEWKPKEDTDEKFDQIDICGNTGLYGSERGELESAFLDDEWVFYAGGGDTATLTKDGKIFYVYYMSDQTKYRSDGGYQDTADMRIVKKISIDDVHYYGTIVMPCKMILDSEEELKVEDIDWGFLTEEVTVKAFVRGMNNNE